MELVRDLQQEFDKALAQNITQSYMNNSILENTLSHDANTFEKRETFDQYMRELVSETENHRKLFDKKWQ